MSSPSSFFLLVIFFSDHRRRLRVPRDREAGGRRAHDRAALRSGRARRRRDSRRACHGAYRTRGKGVLYADTVSSDEPSPDRRPVVSGSALRRVPYAHISYPRQLAIKSDVIADAFARIGRVALPGPVTVAPSPEEGYRMRARLHVRGQRYGFFREGTHDICDARATRQLLPASCDVLDRLTAAIRSVDADAGRSGNRALREHRCVQPGHLPRHGERDGCAHRAAAVADGGADRLRSRRDA